MSQGQEVIELSGSTANGGEPFILRVPIVRGPSDETYLALSPPEAQPYVVAPVAANAQEVVAFVQQRMPVLLELRRDMIKHFSKTKSLKCHFRTGDVVHLLGRPFMLRVNPLSSTKKSKRVTRGLASLSAKLYNDLSLLELFVSHIGNFEQGQAAFMSYAQPIFARNVKSLLEQSLQRVFGQVTLPKSVKCRPMRDRWVHLDEEHDAVWFSESLIPYPPHAVVYAYLAQAIDKYAADADEAKRCELLQRGVPDWPEMRALLADSNCKYAL